MLSKTFAQVAVDRASLALVSFSLVGRLRLDEAYSKPIQREKGTPHATLVFHRWLRPFPPNIAENLLDFPLYSAAGANSVSFNPAVPTRACMRT